ncbi:MAG: patatin-like phospholipase family protein [Nitrospirales bacterium]
MRPIERNQEVQLALSGGGYRAMLFHVGALWRLNEYGQLSKISHVSSVSGGSLVAGLLAANWQELDFDKEGIARRFRESVVEPLSVLAGKTIDVWAGVWGLVPLPFFSAAHALEYFYKKNITGGKALADIPSFPIFIFNATTHRSAS